MKRIFLVFVLLVSFGANARIGGGDSPTPFPLGQAPKDMVGQWKNLEKDETIVITYFRNGNPEQTKLFATVFSRNRKSSHGYLYFNGEMYCGIMRKIPSGKYNLCVWKENQLLKTATFADGDWGSFRRHW